MSKPLPEDLDEKYAKMWHDSCSWDIPSNIEPFATSDNLIRQLPNLKNLYAEACWKVLDMMANDGLIRQATLRRIHDDRNGWPRGRSTIKSGYVGDDTN